MHIESGNSFNTYGISADQTVLDFGTSDYGVTPPDAETITITNNGNTAIRLDEIDTSTATAFTITPLSDTYLLSGETATFTVRPKENLTAGEEFDQQIGVYTNRSDKFISPITLKFKINAFQYKLTPETSEVDFGPFKEENYPDEEKTIWLQNDSSVTNGTLHLKSEDLENYFGLQKFTLESDGTQISKGNRINLTICPRYDLEPGVHTETLVIDTVEGAKATINLKIEVVAWDYTITADKTTLDFGRANIGYATAPEAKDIVITNEGEKAVTLCDPATFSSRYEISLKSGSLALGVDETLTLSVRPKVGLSGGNETIKIKTVQGSEVSVEVRFKVGHYLKGNVNASDLIDNEYYYVIGDTTINIAPGDDKKLRGIWGEQTTDEYNLIIQGSNAGKLSIEGPVYGSYDDGTKTLSVKGGTIECEFIRAGGDIEISGGDITAEYIRSKSGNVTISGGSVKAENPEDWYSITGKDIVIGGGYISASSKSRASIYATNDLTVTGGVIKAKSSEGESSYGMQANDDLSIEGDAYITAEGAKEAILGNPVSIAEGFKMRSGSNDVHISDSSSHWGHLVTVTDELVKSVTIGKDILGESSREFNKENFDFGTAVIGGDAVEAQAVLIRNTGSIPLVIESISTENYIVEDLSSSIIGVGGTVTFKIRPDLEKPKFSTAGEKTETITVKFSDIEMDIAAKIRMVETAPAIAAAPALLDFGTVPKGYTGLFDTKTVVVTNTGNIAVTLNEPAITGTVFDRGALSRSHLAPGESAELTISVKDDAAATAGEHTGTLTITGEHSVTSSVSLKLVVEDVGDNIWIEDITDQDYAGSAVKPEVNVYFGSRKLTDQDYSVSYKNNVNAAQFNAKNANGVSIAPVVIVKGKGNYAGTAAKTFTIKPLDIGLADAPDLLYAYNSKKAQYGKTKVTYDLGGKTVTLKENTDFTYEWGAGDYKTENTTYTTKIIGKGNYQGTTTFYETIAGSDQILISKVTVPKIPDQPYQGKKIILKGLPEMDETPAVDKKGDPYDFVIKNSKTPLNYGSDYTLSYAENLEIGTATMTITGKDDYVGSRTVTFRITGTALSKAKTENFVSSMPYSGSARLQPMKFYFMKKNSEGINVKDYLTENVDYRADYTDNTEIGTATVTYTGIGAYTGTVKKTYKI
ncbi:MAG: choice-of-anchor D domain-containing protein, partial [Lachnospiraceae bacterium]|nr:choice-of-anchor D domain-containing protein [Lachnospiraceae bacterium]